MGQKFKITYARSPGGAWLASIYTVPGCHASGGTQEAARAKIQENLRLFFDDLNGAEFTEEVTDRVIAF